MDLFDQTGDDWKERLAYVLDTVREMSGETEPEKLVRTYSARLRRHDLRRVISLSRRGVEPPRVVLARDSDWTAQPDVWQEREKLPVFDHGLFSEVAYQGEVRVEQDLRLDPADPAAPVLAGYRSLVAIPVFDGGEPLNTLLLVDREPNRVRERSLPHLVWLTNLFARATYNLVTARRLRAALAELDREADLVAEIQLGLLPARPPEVDGAELAVHYEPAHHAGGDYYDFFPLERGRWGILVADASGHGTPAAVEMAITRTLAHVAAGGDVTARSLLGYLNRGLCARHTTPGGSFVTAFFGIYDPATRELSYALAGHPPPRLRRCATSETLHLDTARALPLGIMADQIYPEESLALGPGDQIVAYTDGITEAQSPGGEFFGPDGVDAVLARCGDTPRLVVDRLVAAVRAHAGDRPLADDVTLLVMRVG